MSTVRFACRVIATRRSPMGSVDAILIRDPVDLPVLAAVVRERLLEMWRLGPEPRPIEFHQNALVIERVLRVELAMPRRELPYLRRHDESILAVGPVQAPLARLRIEEPQREAHDLPRRARHIERVELGAATPEWRAITVPREIDPLSRAGERLQTPLQAIVPAPQQRLEVALSGLLV